MITHMLVPLDGSEYGEQALEYATGLAKTEGSRVTLLTVIIRYDRSLHQVVKLDEASRQLAMEYLEPLRDRLSQGGIRAEAKVVFGPPADAIAGAAIEAGALAVGEARGFLLSLTSLDAEPRQWAQS